MGSLGLRSSIAAASSVLFAFALAEGCGTDNVQIPNGPGDAGPTTHTDATNAGHDAAVACTEDSNCTVGNICVSSVCAPGCRSGRDCPATLKVCDTTDGPNGTCVECASATDCPAGDACLSGACVKSCSTDADCPGQHCDTTKQVCVDCVTTDQCAIGDLCISDACVPGCMSDRDCPSATPKCDASTPPHGACVQCLQPSDCGTGMTCTSGACVTSCSTDADCPGEHCDTTTHACVACTSTPDCALGNVCVMDNCTPGCGGDRDCPASTPKCDTTEGPNGTCVQCLVGGDCGTGGVCNNGTCVTTTGASTLVSIPATTFTMGSLTVPDGGTDDTTPHTVTLSAYSIEQLEVTNTAYAACVTAGACAVPLTATNYDDSAQAMMPVTFLTWEMANDFCMWEGRRLPTEAEWEYAARSSDGRTWPWGETEPNCTLTNADVNAGQACVGALSAVDTHTTGASPFGLEDMAGNAREWTEDWYVPYTSAAASDPHGPGTGTMKLARGGSWAALDTDLTTYTRPQRDPSSNDAYIGFRCAKSAGTVAAVFKASSLDVAQGATVTFDASGSFDPIDPSSSLQVRWDFNGDGIWDTSYSTTKTASHAYATSANYTVAMEVMNTRGDVERGVHLMQVAPPPGTGGDGTDCVGDAAIACLSAYTCVVEQGVCRETCSGPGATCIVSSETCQLDPDDPFGLTYVCF